MGVTAMRSNITVVVTPASREQTCSPTRPFFGNETFAVPAGVHDIPSRETEPAKVSPARSSFNQRKPVKRPWVTAGSGNLFPRCCTVVSAAAESRVVRLTFQARCSSVVPSSKPTSNETCAASGLQPSRKVRPNLETCELVCGTNRAMI